MFKDKKGKKKYCWRFWPFFQHDYKFIKPYLEEREKKGYRLCSLGYMLPLARYQKVEPQKARYDVDIFREKQWIEIQPYLDFCEDCGWEICWQWYEYKIFRAADGKNPAPLHTDWDVKREQERDIIKRDVRNNAILFFCLCMPFLLFVKIWDWADFYLDTYAMQYMASMFLATMIGGCCVLLNRLWNWYSFCNDEERWRNFHPSDGLNGRKKWSILFKICTYFVLGSVLVAFLFSLANDSLGWGGVIGWIIGTVIGTAIRISARESDWPRKQRMKGVHSKKYIALIISLFILCSTGGYLYLDAKNESFPSGNFFMKEIQRDNDYYSFYYGGSCIFEAKTKQTADKMWRWIDQDIREHQRKLEMEYGDKKPEEGSLMKRQSLEEEELRCYGDYERGYFYPKYGRVLLQKEKKICITDKK